LFFGRQDPGSEVTLVIPGLFKFVLGVLIILALLSPVFGIPLLEGVK
jgi:hypothetical protein